MTTAVEPTPAAKPAPSKPAPPVKSTPRAFDETDAIAVCKLMFSKSIDVPGEQGVRSLMTKPRDGKPQYRILWLPRIDKYLVRAGEMRGPGALKPTFTFTIPGAWAIAEFE